MLGMPHALSVPESGAQTLAPGEAIQPGQRLITPSGSCTLNFVYDGIDGLAGKVYIGTAAHCFRSLHDAASTPMHGAFGHVVYMGDYFGANVPDHDNGIPGEQYDFALIEVKPEFHHAVRAEVVGHPGLPRSGVYPPGAVLLGDRLDLSGHGVGFSTTQQTRESRFGFYWRDFQTEWQAVAPIMPGDSGGPVLHEDGRAFGVVTHLGSWGAGGPYLHEALAQVQDLGWSIQLRTAS